MAEPDIRVALEASALNGERPAWDAERRRLYWVDIREPALHEFDPETGQDRHWEMPAWIGCYALTDTGALVALRTGLFALDFETGALTHLAVAPFDARRFTFNEGDTDRQGRFWAGPMYVPLAPGDQSPDHPDALPFWRWTGRDFQPGTPAVKTANSLAWSVDGRRIYFGDTAQRSIWTAPYDLATGEAGTATLFARVDIEGADGPDGMAIDRDGYLWCAVFGGGRLLRFGPDGYVERTIRLPVRYPTMPAFGGPDLKTLFVTSAKWPVPADQRDRHPLEGHLLAFEVDVPGLPATRFAPG